MKKRIEGRGIRPMDAPPGQASGGLWFTDPHGLLVKGTVAAKTSSDAKAGLGAMDGASPQNVIGSFGRRMKPAVRPLRFAHLLVFVPSIPDAIAFYSRVPGLRLSDRAGDIMAFLHGIHGSDHHMIAFVNSGGQPAGLHHLSWDRCSINGIGLGAMQLADRGFTKGRGLGRHVLGSNYFHYMPHPREAWSEYSADIDFISLDNERQAKDLPPEDGICVRGPDLPQDFLHDYEADHAEAKT
jgi:catechol 2,3-dioxygenase